MNELAARLRTCSLFEKLPEDELEYLASLGEVQHHPHGAVVIRQGDPGDAFYVVLSGHLEVLQVDEKRRERTVNYHMAGHYFGEGALFTGKPRAATVRAMDDVELAVFDRRAFEQLCSRHPDIRNYLLRTRVDFPGRQRDEVADVYTRRHPYAVVERFFLPMLVLVLWVGITFGLQLLLGSPFQAALPWAWVAFSVLWLLWAVLLYIDWINDAFIVSTKRVLHIERVLLLREERREAPIDQVVSVTMETSTLMARVLGFGTLIIRTASLGDPIVFDHLAEAGRIQQVILELRDRARAYRVGEKKGQRRRMLQEHLGLQEGKTEPWIPQPPPPPPEPKGALHRFFDYFVPRMVIAKPGEVTWRRHWYVLIKKVAAPLLALFLAASLIVTSFFPLPLIGRISNASIFPYLIALSVLLLLPLLGWLWWRYEDWRNDIYTVTATSIIDRESAPFGFREQKRVGSLEDIESVYSHVPNFLAKVINLGDVIIDTAGAPRAYTFDSVPDPIAVQREIFSRMQAYRERKSQRESQAEMERWADWFDEYHRLASGKGQTEGESRP
jgi:uncharacterized membrane protein YdbT with pleckstrin-like domain